MTSDIHVNNTTAISQISKVGKKEKEKHIKK